MHSLSTILKKRLSKQVLLLVVLIVVLITLFSPIFSHTVLAQGIPPPPAAEPSIFSPYGWYKLPVAIAKWTILSGLVEIIKGINVMLVWLVGITAQVMDAGINTSLAGLSGIPAIQRGWELTRDITNIFFIFILLIIAIATILRLESYGAKQLLVRVVVVALLVNFSLVIAFTIVDMSNIIALTFIKRIHPVSANMARILEISKFNAMDVVTKPGAEIRFTEALSIGWDQLLGKYNQAPPGLNSSVISKSTGAAANPLDGTTTELFFQVVVLILQLVLMFVFISIAGLMLIRSVALIIIFILAPFGFLAAILPATRGLSKRWWDKLFQWSFFFPASAFFMYIAIYYGSVIKTSLNSTGSHAMNTALLFNYFVVVALLMASLLVARQMGIMGAGFFIGMGLAAARRARGYAGKTTMAGVYATGRMAARTAGPISGKFAEKFGTYGTLGRFAAKPFARLQTAGETAIENMKKQYKGISDNAFKARKAAAVTPQAQRAAREAAVEDNKVHLLTPDERRIEHERATRQNNRKDIRAIEIVTPELARTGKIAGSPEERAAVTRAVQGASAEDIRTKTDAESIKTDLVADAVLLNYGNQKLEASAEAFGTNLGPALEGAFDRLVAAKKVEMALAGKTFATPTDEQVAAEEETIKQMNKENPDVVKFASRNQMVNLSSGLGTKVSGRVKQMNEAAEQEAEDALRAREARRPGGGAPSAQEIAQARRGARKIEI